MALDKENWYLDDKFDNRADAQNIMKSNAENSSWKIWKIEEVYDYSPDYIKN